MNNTLPKKSEYSLQDWLLDIVMNWFISLVALLMAYHK